MEKTQVNPKDQDGFEIASNKIKEVYKAIHDYAFPYVGSCGETIGVVH